MEISINFASISSFNPSPARQFRPYQINRGGSVTGFRGFSGNKSTPRFNSNWIRSSSVRDLQGCKSKLESLYCYDKSVPEEIIEKPVGLSLDEKNIGNNPRCTGCQAKGAVLCATCSGSGLYIDSIMESQGIIVKVRCLGCGGTGNIMCPGCGGRGHLGSS
ncbi:hypothetical protein QJS04_geneDACA009458 [Acorus gramineus]|uniref:Uncharacterized protein n=1 Tax=Acorus gramineus TaxID=55184 RepID=A0AAV9AJS9_ACOGR|nr:hypothetical protein QJS04_geneDACA009458 [Acorus gramineus]